MGICTLLAPSLFLKHLIDASITLSLGVAARASRYCQWLYTGMNLEGPFPKLHNGMLAGVQ